MNFGAQQRLLKNIRTEMAKLLEQEDVRKLFQEKVRGYCEQLQRWSDPARPTVYTREPTALGAYGPLGMVATLMKRGPYEMDDAYFLLAAVHDTGEFAKDVGPASPPEWDVVAQSLVSPEKGLDLSDPQHVQWAAHWQWHLTLDQVDMVTLDALKRLTTWVPIVRQDGATAREDGAAHANESEEVAWSDDAPEYMLLSEARKALAPQMSLPALSKKMRPGCGVRHMRKPRRCKVHIGDFRQWVAVEQREGNDADSSAEKAARMFAEYKKTHEEKRRGR